MWPLRATVSPCFQCRFHPPSLRGSGPSPLLAQPLPSPFILSHWLTHPLKNYLLVLEHAITAIDLGKDTSSSLSTSCPPSHLPPVSLLLPNSHRLGELKWTPGHLLATDGDKVTPRRPSSPLASSHITPKPNCSFRSHQLSETEPASGALIERLGSRALGLTRRGAGLA